MRSKSILRTLRPAFSWLRCWRLQNWQGAVGHYQGALKLVPSHSGAKLSLGRLHLLANNPDRALELAEEILATDPNHADALALRAGSKAK